MYNLRLRDRARITCTTATTRVPLCLVGQVNTLGHFSVELLDKCERRS